MDKEWAFDQQNFGPGLYSEYHYEGVFVVDGAGRTRYAVINGKVSTMPVEQWLGKLSRSVVDEARAMLENETALVKMRALKARPPLSPPRRSPPAKYRGWEPFPVRRRS